MALDASAMHWLPQCTLQTLRAQRKVPPAGSHIMLCVVDHYEPSHGGAGFAQGLERVDRWVTEYPRIFGAFKDADAAAPRHTFFFPMEEYVPEYLDRLRVLCGTNQCEIEIHLHHDNDTSQALKKNLIGFVRVLRERHGLLPTDPWGAVRYGFIHGNYALDNSRPDGRWCGVNNELEILIETGCYGDFTLPSAPNPTQTSALNSVYFAVDDPGAPKSHDTGVRARVGGRPPSDSLLIVQGALALNLRDRKWGLLPRLENSELLHNNPPTAARVLRCVNMRVGVVDRPEWIFVKLHTHGAIERNADMLLGSIGARFHSELGDLVRARGWHLHYVTSREVTNIVWAAIDGKSGNPKDYRDYKFRLADYQAPSNSTTP